MDKEYLRNLSEKKLLRMLSNADWCDRELLKEYDERCYDGRIKFNDPIPQNHICEFIRNKYAQKRRKKAS